MVQAGCEETGGRDADAPTKQTTKAKGKRRSKGKKPRAKKGTGTKPRPPSTGEGHRKEEGRDWLDRDQIIGQEEKTTTSSGRDPPRTS